MKVNIVPSEGKGWIIGRMIHELSERNGWSVGPTRSDVEINYFVNYHAARPLLIQRPTTLTAAWFTHPEGTEFFSIARRVDIRISHSAKYASVIGGFTSTPGIDEHFKPRLRLGVVGRTYDSGRKGEDMLIAVEQLDFVDIVTPPPLQAYGSDQEWLATLPGFYASLDALLVTSLVEGGPLPAAEATACGVPVIAPSSVGNLAKLDVIDFPVGDVGGLLDTIKRFSISKFERASLVADWSWARFAQEHQKIFDQALKHDIWLTKR